MEKATNPRENPTFTNFRGFEIVGTEYLRLFKELLKIRLAEKTLASWYKKQEMRTPTHFGLGQEAIAVGVCSVLERTDVVYSYHRCHNHFLAKGGSIYKLAAELFGRESGCSGGRGGSVHLTDRENGFIASSAILGESVAAATGSALAFKMDNKESISTAFFGDAVAEEGVFYESLSYSKLKNLPLLLICENNGYATESPLSARQPSEAPIYQRVESFGIPSYEADGNDLVAIVDAAQKAIQHIRQGHGPYYLEFKTYRWLEHVGPYYDFEQGRDYRSEEELMMWKQNCPVKIAKEYLLARKILDSQEIIDLETSIQNEVDSDIERAYTGSWPSKSTLFRNI